MAITLDELLGRNTAEKQSSKEVGNFPAYENWNRRQDNQANSSDNSFDFSGNSARAANANGNDYHVENNSRGTYANGSDYHVENNNRGFNTRSFDTRVNSSRNVGFDTRVDSNRNSAFDTRVDNSRNSAFDARTDNSRGYEQYKNIANTSRMSATERVNMYEFTASDCDRLADDALYEKLSHTNNSRKPLFDRDMAAANAETNRTFFAPKEAKSEDTKKHTRGKLNAKGKILLGVYIAVIVTIAVLIIVNAGNINNGTAKTPSSSISRSVGVDR